MKCRPSQQVSKKHGPMPFTLRSCENETKAKMGVVECVTHKLIEPFQVLYEKEGEHVAQFKFTVLLMPNGPHKITGVPLDLDTIESEKSIEDLDIQVSYRNQIHALMDALLQSLFMMKT